MGITQCTWDHTERSRVERVGAGPGLLLLGSRAGPRGLWAYSSLENLKHKSRNLEHWKRNKWLKGSDVRINQVL